MRLYQGDYDKETVYGEDPVAQAKAFVAEGATILHVVDLDAALTGEPTNRDVIGSICAAIDIPVQVGGGVRTREAAEALVDRGVDRVVIGTAALEHPELVGELVEAGHSVAVGIDAHGEEVATHGWTERTGRTTTEVANQFAELGVAALVVTEIGRDGTMEDPDVSGLAAVLDATSAYVNTAIVASGGVGVLDHIRAVAALGSDGRSLDGVIVGRALYENAFSLTEAIAAARRGEAGHGEGDGK